MPQVVEVIGPAGAGKTTLCEMLSRDHTSIYLNNFPDVRKLSSAPFFIWNVLQISPTLLDLAQHTNQKLSRREFAWLSILHGWSGVLRKDLKNNKTILLDQGPVYLLTELYESNPGFLQSQAAEMMQRKIYERWAKTLDVIVWLDATDKCLLERINSRQKNHPIKNEAAEVVYKFLSRFRNAYEQIIPNLSAYNPELTILRFDTTQKEPAQIANQLLNLLSE